ncbi:MAG: dienelactone hydrolase family protein [Candidatus Neomarinimicrobiota bacterium]
MTAAVPTKLILTTFKTSANSNKAVIGLHGWAGDEKSFLPVAKAVNLKSSNWFMPRAPYDADAKSGGTWFSGTEKSGWNYKKSWDGLDDLLKEINSRGFSSKNTYLVGFSQGAAFALEYSQRLPFKLGGIVAIAGFIKNIDKLARESSPASLNNSILILHGEQDDIIAPFHSKKIFDFLSKRGNTVRLETYPARHNITAEAISLINDFIENNK